MARPKKSPEEEMQSVIGVKLTDDLAERVRTVGNTWGLKPAGAGRELLLLGLSMVESLRRQGVEMPFLDLTEAYRRPLPEMPQNTDQPKPFDNSTLDMDGPPKTAKVTRVHGAEYANELFGQQSDSQTQPTGGEDLDVTKNPSQRKDAVALANGSGDS